MKVEIEEANHNLIDIVGNTPNQSEEGEKGSRDRRPFERTVGNYRNVCTNSVVDVARVWSDEYFFTDRWVLQRARSWGW